MNFRIFTLTFRRAFRRGQRFLGDQAPRLPLPLWFVLLGLFVTRPVPRVMDFLEDLPLTTQQRINKEVSARNFFVENARYIFVHDKGREDFMERLVTYGIPGQEALTIMNSVTEFNDKTNTNFASKDYANISENSPFLRFFGAPPYTLKGFFPDAETHSTWNGLVFLESPTLGPFVDGDSCRKFLTKVHKELKLTYTEQVFLINAHERSKR